MKWIEPSRHSYSFELHQAAGGNDLLAHLLWERGIRTPEAAVAFLDPRSYQSTSLYDLPGMKAGIREILDAIREKKLIGVWGDFDVDGQTATTLLVSAFRQLGGRVEFHIPVRATESHGIRLPNLKTFLEKGIELLVTCDTGISENEGIAYAREHGVGVVITDHHDLPAVLPEAEAIINPKLLSKEHPLAQLPGVGVAYKLVEGLFAESGMGTTAEQYLDLVALGIVSDVAEVRADTRYLLQRGILALRSTRRLGLRLLFDLAEIEQQFITEEEIGFSIGPRLNAMGRLGDANPMVEFLTTDEESVAAVTAHQLEGLNAERKVQTDQVYQAVLEKLESQTKYAELGAVVVAGEKWPPGVIGLVAGRISTKEKKPAIVLTKGEGEVLKGSARSVEGVDISAAIRACDDLLLGFGGHPMAAGLSMKSGDLPAFRRKLDRAVAQQTGGAVVEPELRVDQYLGIDEINLSTVMGLAQLSPYGPGNSRPVFGSKDLKVVSHSTLGRSKNHRRMVVEDQNGSRETILWWFGAQAEIPSGWIDLAFTAGVNRFRGEVGLQLTFVDNRPGSRDGMVEIDDIGRLKVFDFRNQIAPTEILAKLDEIDLPRLIWGEGVDGLPGDAVNRQDLHQTDNLVLWTVPPTFSVLRSVIEAVKPERVYVFAIKPVLEGAPEFFKRLAGLLKFVVSKREGLVGSEEIAAKTGLTASIIDLGIKWLEAKGVISVERATAGGYMITIPGSGRVDVKTANTVEREFSRAWKEIDAFREYFSSCSEADLIDSLDQIN